MPSRNMQQPMTLSAWIAGVLILTTVVGVAPASADDTGTLKLRRQVVVTDAPSMGDVLIFVDVPDTLRQQISAIPLVDARVARKTGRLEISHTQLMEKLQDAGLNVGSLLVGGAARCNVSIVAARTNADAAPETVRRPRTVRPNRSGTQTLEDVLRTRLAEELSRNGGTISAEFEHAARDLLDLTTPPWDFQIHASIARDHGLRELRVAIRRDGVTQRQVRVFARVHVTRKVVIARKALGLGTYIEPEDLTLEERTFPAGQASGLTATEPLLGRKLKSFVPAGMMVTEAELSQEPLVKRTRPVTVHRRANNVSIRLTGVALDNGGLGETVRVRLGPRGRNQRVVQAVVTGVGAVRIAKGQS